MSLTTLGSTTVSKPHNDNSSVSEPHTCNVNVSLTVVVPKVASQTLALKYDEWKKVATHHRTQYIRPKV